MKPRVGISRCLLGDEVRYDGTHKRAGDLLAALGRHVEWVPVCPEVEVGMGTPREPIHIVPGGRLLGVTSGEDWTERMQEWARQRIETLRALKLSGFVLKARSPSCGIKGVPVGGRGLFAGALIDAMPDLPIVDEDDLADARARETFLRQVRTFRP